ncbi:MAG: hypothetical protein HC767_01135 [Akkermansiaceae bacterium]|nr:hypothetical protein [Akkermansiaceae bacterium]
MIANPMAVSEKEGKPQSLEISLPVADGELVKTNNSRKFNIAGAQRKSASSLSKAYHAGSSAS